jgi:hypothetical protein
MIVAVLEVLVIGHAPPPSRIPPRKPYAAATPGNTG